MVSRVSSAAIWRSGMFEIWSEGYSHSPRGRASWRWALIASRPFPLTALTAKTFLIMLWPSSVSPAPSLICSASGSSSALRSPFSWSTLLRTMLKRCLRSPNLRRISSSLESVRNLSASGATGCCTWTSRLPVRPPPELPGITLSASTRKKISSASRAEFHADFTIALLRRWEGRASMMPGVSMKISWVPPAMAMPVMELRVVWRL
mmetsp:Transcript_34549/g.81849  ORF Transcript_34549/g.81849 Transcript_34549/m.81849 type:complete len:206 (+) Transcript_34549:272-889(+)